MNAASPDSKRCAAFADHESPACRSASQPEYLAARVVYDDPAYLKDHDHPKKVVDAEFVLQLFCDPGGRIWEIRTARLLNSCMESETVERPSECSAMESNRRATFGITAFDGEEFLVPPAGTSVKETPDVIATVAFRISRPPQQQPESSEQTLAS